MPRQTELSFEEIVEKLETDNTGMPGAACGGTGLLVNELGELGQEGNERVEKELIKILSEHITPEISYPACGWLGLIGTEKAIEPLKKFVKKTERMVGRVEAVREMAKKSISLIYTRLAEKN